MIKLIKFKKLFKLVKQNTICLLIASVFLNSTFFNSIGKNIYAKLSKKAITSRKELKNKQKEILNLKKKIAENKSNQHNQVALKQELNNKLEDVINKTQTIQTQIDNIKKNSDVHQNQINDLNAKIMNSENKINELNVQIAQKKEQINSLKADFKKKIKRIYYFLKHNPIEILMASGSCETFSEITRLTTYLQSISSLNENLIANFNNQTNQLNALKTNEEESKNNIETCKNQIEKNFKILTDQETQLNNLKSELNSNIKILKNNLDQIEKNSQHIQNLINNWENEVKSKQHEINENIEEYNKMIEKTPFTATPSQNKSINNPPSSSTAPATAPSNIKPGKWCFPVKSPCYVSRGYNLKKRHKGLDIATGGKANAIVAVADGVVSFASSGGYGSGYGGYGKCVVINHGNGLSTLYAHMSAIKVSSGMKVSQGTCIGLVGCTGQADGVHCHFEVRKNGQPINPSNYV